MADFPNRAQLFDVFRNELLTRAELRPIGDRVSPVEIDTPGSDINLIGAGASAMGEEIVRAGSSAVNDLTLDGAKGLALDRYVADRYSPLIVRKSAARAVVELQFTRSSIAAGANQFDAGEIVQTSGGVRFKTLAVAAFGATSLGPVTVQAKAVDAGTTGNVSSGTITKFVSARPDSSWLVTNPERAAGGDFTESDESLRNRTRLFYQQARRGVLGAIEFGALTVPGVQQATAEEVLNSLGVPNGFIFLYISDANGQSNEILNQKVKSALLEYRAGGMIVNVFGAVPTLQSVEYDLSWKAGIDTSAGFDQVRAVTVARVNSLAPGMTLLRSLLFEAARSVNGAIVEDFSVVVPTGDVVPAQGQVIRTRTDLVNPSTS